jgi:hypothetical protein
MLASLYGYCKVNRLHQVRYERIENLKSNIAVCVRLHAMLASLYGYCKVNRLHQVCYQYIAVSSTSKDWQSE